MRFMKALISAILLSGMLAAAQAPANTVTAAIDGKQAKATVHIYRYKQFVGSALAPSIYCDGAELARMENGRYFTAKLEPGKHTLTSNDKQSGIDLDMKAGEEYFIRVEIAAGFAKGHGRLILVPREQGGYELKADKLKPLDSNKVANKDVVSVDEWHLQNTSFEEKK